jgi:hypothetical protein
MPYKATGKSVLVKKRGRWVRLRQMVSEAAAKAHAAALNAATRGH